MSAPVTYHARSAHGTGRTLGDIIAPALPPEAWEAIGKAPRR